MVVKERMREASRLCHRQKFHSLESQGRDLHPLQESTPVGIYTLYSSENRPDGSGRCCLHPRGTVKSLIFLPGWWKDGMVEGE